MQNSIKNFLKYWGPLCIYAGIIFYVSSISKPLPDIGIPSFDKLLHVFEFVVFGFLASRAFRHSSWLKGGASYRIVIWASLAAILYGISDEFHQSFVPGRIFSLFDVLADSIGGTLGAFIYGRNHTI
ncbi:MAG: VanZ family protein [Candidatus Omnitrophica bacterium]|nr:VanZ family protein [Candidatus Omnitrophota bacterium]